ncbi:MAG: DUF4910 domain-containing protein [Candidatus Heimdallarchaeota archaeon]|nr:DUF4910 domain-containing protein [Candidatus Heimdallarchaeota archaeon]
MFKKILSVISKEFSGENAKELTAGIANFHRIQSSPGFRAAANYCQSRLNEYKIPYVSILSYPANGNNTYWGYPIPKEWNITSATLDLIEPKADEKNLCRFFEVPCSVIQRSKATPKEGIVGEVIILPSGLDEKAISEYDIKGKFILTDDSNLNKLRMIAIKKLGAVGVIYDLVSELKPIRTKANFPSARRYTSFWYGTKGEEGDALGFVLSAEQGNELRKLIKKVEKENSERIDKSQPEKKVKVRAKIDASFYNGEMEVVECFIPGEIEDEKEILVVAHLCHPKPSAVDNASGCGTIIETARTLKTLIANGQLKKPKRGIRFLLMAEFTGTYCYLATHEDKIENFIAGINLDMVGADQDIGGGRTLIMEKTHLALPSYVNDVLSAIVDEAAKEVINFQGTGAYATFKYANDQPFSGGSDHFLLGYPDIGIGTPMFIQWPDRYYHTSEDTIEKVSSKMLHLVGSLTATYCYFLANAELPDILWCTQEIATKGRERITNFGRKYVNELLNKLQTLTDENKNKEQSNIMREAINKVERRFTFRKEIEVMTLYSLRLLTTKNDEKGILEEMLNKEQNILTNHTASELEHVKFTLEKLRDSFNISIEPNITNAKEAIELQAETTIPYKKFRGPVGLGSKDLTYEEELEYKKITEQYKEVEQTLTSAFFWINNKRTVAEIAELVENEHNKTSIPLLMKIFQFYEKHDLLKLKQK